MKDQKQLKTFCRTCFGRCSLITTVEDRKVTRVASDNEAPIGRDGLCVKGAALPKILNHPDRLRYPLKRRGQRGTLEWLQISWDEALDTVASKLTELREKFGSESVAIGTGDPKGLELAFAQRFASAWGTPNITTPGHICHMPSELASTFTFGAACVADSDCPSRCILIWGSNPSTTRNGLSPKQLQTALDAGAKLIVIDPRRTEMASRADIWIKPRPGSDGVLALAMVKTIIEEHLYDETLIASYTVGFDQLEKETKAFSMKEMENITWVPEEQIKKAAILYAQTRPATIQWGNALEQTTNSFQTCRTVSILRILTGNLDIPGGDILVTPPPVARPGQFMLLKEFPRKAERTAGSEFKLAIRSAFIPRQSLVEAILAEKPYAIKSALLFGTNPLLTYPNAQETYKALTKLDFLMVADLFLTPTAALADIVLPVAGNGEFNEVAPYPSRDGTILAYPKVSDAPGQCWSDMKIINELAKRVGLRDYFWDNEEEALDLILKPSGMTFEEFKNIRIIKSEGEYKKYESKGFRTPTGKAEIYSKQLEELGYSPLPSFSEISGSTSQSQNVTKEYPLLLTNAKELAFCHSAHRGIASLRHIKPEPVVELAPETADRLGVKEGEWVYIETSNGKIRQKLQLNADLDPRVVVASYGWWFPEKKEDLFGWSESNINMLTESSPNEPALGSVCFRGIPCRILKGSVTET